MSSLSPQTIAECDCPAPGTCEVVGMCLAATFRELTSRVDTVFVDDPLDDLPSRIRKVALDQPNVDPLDDLVSRVLRFNREIVKIDLPVEPRPLGAAEARWLQSALVEEADELVLAEKGPDGENATLVEQVDACVDSVIFAIGGLFRMGLTPPQVLRCLHVVMDANFQKKAGVKAGREGAPDAVKPEGWVGPEARIKEVLGL